MKRYIAILALAVLVALAACTEKADVGPLSIDFVHDYQKGLSMAKEQGKPIMLVFEADWCGACQELKSTVFTDKSVGEASKRLINISVNVDKDKESPNQYQVRYIPAVFFLDPSGANVMPYQGPRTPEHFIKMMNAFGDRFSS
ncbi:thioredoxin family protein [Desulfatibacillum aliphaticivorans]|uniref:thioredoxin family protein n=1 Tax=Desulfatibacillum aliphaticivorans TaxID=218208 RepID=UPI0003FB2CC5|nr:thioredoxin family protein [Desulfatibacillum aliphaticivorans]